MGLLTPKEAATELRSTVKQVWGLIHDGELGYVDVGRGTRRPRMMIDRRDLDAFIEKRKRRKVAVCLTQKVGKVGKRTERAGASASGSAASADGSKRIFQLSEMRKRLLGNTGKDS